MLKITAKTTKEQLKSILGANVSAVKKQDKDLFDRISYADKMAKQDDSKVTRKDLADLAKEVVKLLGESIVNPLTPQATPVAENATKKLTTKGKTQKKADSKEVGESEEEEPQETPAETPKAEAKGAEKKSAKKSSLGKKKDEPKKDGATASSTKKTVQNKAFVLAEVFPETFEIEGNKYEIAKDISNMGQLQDAVNDGEPIVFAMYWTNRHLRQFEYGGGDLKAPKEFPLDLDLATCLFVAEDSTVAYAISAYTNVCYMYLPDDIEESDGLRFSKGIEYQIYRMVE